MGQVVDLATINAAKAAMDLAVETVSFTYLMWNTHVYFPKKLVNVMLAPKFLKPVREQLRSAKVSVTPQMEKVLTLWESGYMVDEVAKKAYSVACFSLYLTARCRRFLQALDLLHVVQS